MADRYWYGGSGTIGIGIRWSSKSPALFTASISGTTLTVTAVTGGTIALGDTIYATGATRGTVTAFGTGSGGIGTYTLSASNTLSSRIMWAVVPSSLLNTDNANFVSTSSNASYTVTWNTTVFLANLAIAAPSAGTVAISVSSGGTANIAGNFTTAGSGVSVTGIWTVECTGSSGTITTNGLSLSSTIFVINVSGGTYTLGGALTCSELTLDLGTFSTSSTSNYALTCGRLTITGTAPRTLNLNASTVTLTSSSSTAFNAGTITNLTFTAGTSQINLSGATSGISSGGLTFNNVSFTSSAGETLSITGANTFNTLSFAGNTSIGIVAVRFSANQTITTLTLNASTAAAYRTFLASNAIGTQRTLTVTTLTAGAADYDFRDIAISGGAAPISGTRFGDAKGNSGITFPAAKTVYWMLTGGGNWGATGTGAWAASSGGGLDATQFPLAQDTAVLNNTSFASNAGKTATINDNYNIGTIDMSALTVVETLATGTTTPQIYGNWINGTGTMLTGTGAVTFAGRTTQQITSAGKTFTQAITINSPSGSVTLQDAFVASLSLAGVLTVTQGTFDAATYNVTLSGGIGTVSTSGTGTRTVAVGSGTWTLAGGGTVWNAATSTNLTVTGTGTISLTSASAKTFAGGSVSYSSITINQGGAGAMTISGSNTFSDITNTYSATGATTITFTAGTTQTVSSFTAAGAVGKILTINSSSAGSAASLSKASGTVSVDYLSVRDSTATGGAVWYAGSNSTDVSGNTGWIFTRPPETFNSSVSETSTAVDSIAGNFLFFVNVQETIAAIDQVFAAAAFQSTILETSQAVDTATVVVSFQTAASETAQAADVTSVAASTFSAQSSESSTASDSQTAQAVFPVNLSESVSASETATVAASTFGATSAETATAQDSINAPGSTYNPSTSETAQALDTPSAAATFSVASSETAAIADQNAAAFTAATNISESATAADITAALVAFAALTAENASASDQTLVAPSTFNAIAAAAAQAFDSVNAPGSIYNAAVVNTAVALDSIIGAFLWNLIDDSQNPNWTNITDSQTPNWQAISSAQTASWTTISNPQSPGWTGIDDSQTTNWQNIDT